ncbi:DUF255 domain-containing protein [Flavobacterium sp. ZT3R18]|uniref:thioredoxin family protein n=1 Tax=Flavobacterium sp. ZT3R18 TaxID=2594429 RepID=UPI00117B5BDA|nr:thioredoxin fold domain-containing protein [Flavobacterium sp. ZT3R18]TRX34181.1 DUF255 domain-containing protein [Flavobacterium sp. ZT3R18]
MKKIVAIVFFVFAAIPSGFAQLKTYSFEQIDSLQRYQNRKIIVFVHTDWCKYCQAMKNTTFKNKEVIKTLNDNFYFITLNAEEKRTITFNSRKFVFKTNGNTTGIHELAYELVTINNQTTYPTICVLNAQNEIVFQESNYLPAKGFLMVLEKLKE